MSDLYGVLKVPKDASASDIKKAYKKLAQKHHPDKEEGDKEKFQEIVAAYEVLIDDDRRRRYDETGTVENTATDGTKLMREVVALIFKMIDTYDIQYSDIIAAAKDVVKEGIAKQRQAILDLEESIVEREEVITRLTCKTEDDFLVDAIRSDIAARKVGVTNMERNIVSGETLLAKLSDYSYRKDEVPVSASSHAFYTFGGHR